MGIPSYFRFITSQYSDIIIKKLDNKTARLFLDLNGTIHPCAKNIGDKKYNSNYRLSHERKIYKEVVDYIEYLVNFSQPTELLYIAIDGIAPRAKMMQQRYRRYKSVKDFKELEKINKKHNVSNGERWDTNAITPGTQFMHQLSLYLRENVPKIKKLEGVKIILSDSNVPGEGEHKIIEYIKNNKRYNSEYYDLIHGLDADLIMLSLSCNINNICLLREAIEFGNSISMNDDNMPHLLYMNINELNHSLIDELIENGIDIDNDTDCFIKDYIFICFLLGNDFLPHINSLAIKNGGVNILIEYYIMIYNKLKENLIITKPIMQINQKFLELLLNEISQTEDELLRRSTDKILKMKPRIKTCDNPIDYDKEVLNLYPMYNREKEKKVNMGYDDWEQRYYSIVFNTNKRDDINNICSNYFQGLSWTSQYYFNKCISQKWHYKYRHPPTCKDLYNYLKNNKFNINNCVNSEFNCYKPFEQLMMVLPPESRQLLPESYKSKLNSISSGISYLYPIDYQLDTFNKMFLWECLPILPSINEKNLLNEINRYPLTSEEVNRNSISESIIVS